MKKTAFAIAMMLAGLAFGDVTRNTKWYEVPDETLVGTVVDLGQGGGGGGGGCDTNAVTAIVSNLTANCVRNEYTNSTLKVGDGNLVYATMHKVGSSFVYKNGAEILTEDGDTQFMLSYWDSDMGYWTSAIIADIAANPAYNLERRLSFGIASNDYWKSSELYPDNTPIATYNYVTNAINEIGLPSDFAESFYASATTTNINGCTFTIYSQTNWFYAVECKIGDRRCQSAYATGRLSDPIGDEGARYFTYIDPSANDIRKLEFGWKLWAQDSGVQLGVYVYDYSTRSYIVGNADDYQIITAYTHKPYSLYRCTQQSVEDYDLALLKSITNPLATTNYVNTKAAALQTQLNSMASHKQNIIQIISAAEMEGDDRTWDDVVQYVGTTTSKYHYGYFYKMTSYSPRTWEVVSVMDLSGYVPTSRKINGQALTQDVTIQEMDYQGVTNIVTNVVNKVKAEFYDEPLSVNWTVRMVNGEMKLYATTNVNMSVLPRYTNWSTDNLPSGVTWAAQPTYDESIDLWEWAYNGGTAQSEEGDANATTLTFGYGEGFTTTRSVIP